MRSRASAGQLPEVGATKSLNATDQAASRLDIFHDFSSIVDICWLNQVSRKADMWLDKRFELIGEGRQFRCWKIPVTSHFSRRQRKIESLVLKKPTDCFLNSRQILVRWHAAIERLKTAPKLTLIAPFKKLDISDATTSQHTRPHPPFALVMPYGESKALTLEAKHNLDREVLKTDLWLQSQGLRLADIPQVRWIHGLPFIVDLGDIELLKDDAFGTTPSLSLGATCSQKNRRQKADAKS